MLSNHLILFIKAPEKGKVKTRLQPDLTPQQSERLYRAMVNDLVKRFRHHDQFQLTIYFSPARAEEQIAGWLGDDLRLRPQSGNDLGSRMHNAFAESYHDGYSRTVIIGSDLPTLEVSEILSAFRILESHDLVVGPSDDGGYYLIGQNNPDGRLFDHVKWSTETVLSSTLNNANKLGFSPALLRQLADIDTIDELREMATMLKDDPAAAPETAGILALFNLS